MKKLLLALLLTLFAVPALAGDVFVNGYFRSNGTYVQPYHRTSPNNTLLDNYSTKGNINPWTGKAGSVDPYKESYKPYNPYYNNYNTNYDNNTSDD